MQKLSDGMLLGSQEQAARARAPRTDGFYYSWQAPLLGQRTAVGYTDVLYFYEDGICHGSSIEAQNDADSVAVLLSKLYFTTDGARYYDGGTGWGVYAIAGDTLFTERYSGMLNSRLTLTTSKFTFDNSGGPLLISTTRTHRSRRYATTNSVSAPREFKFYPTNQKPDSIEFAELLRQKRLEAVQRKAKKEGK